MLKLKLQYFAHLILKEISPGCSLEGLMLKLKLQYFGHLMRRVDSLEKPWCWEGLGAGGEGDDRGWDGWMASTTRWTWVWVNSGSWWWTGRPGMLRFMELQRVGHDWATELNWRTDSLEKTLILRNSEGRRRRGQQRMRWLDGITNSMDMSLSSLACCSPWDHKESDIPEWLSWRDIKRM